MVKNLPKTAIVFRGVTYSYTQLLQYIEKYSQTFQSKGKAPEKVMIFSDNCPEYYFVTYAAFRCNACVVPVDMQSTPKEISNILDECRPEVIFISEYYRENISKLAAEIPDYDYTILSPSDIDICDIDEMPVIPVPVRKDDHIAAIIYTSGTTGLPKGVMLSHKNFWYNVDSVTNQLPIFNSNSNVMVLLPLHHSYPFVGTILVPLHAGGTCWISDGMKPDSILQTLKEGKITLIVGVPKLYETLAKGIISKINASAVAKIIYNIASVLQWRSFSKLIFKSVHQKFGGHIHYILTGGAAFPKEVAKVFITLGFKILEGYGMTECAPMIAFSRPGEWRYNCIGKALPGCDIKIAENGEILAKGENVMLGYYKKPKESAAIIKEGWLHSGDMGEIDANGILKVTGRIKEIIVTSNGKNINPGEIEQELLKNSHFMKEIAVFLHQDHLHLLIYPEMSAVRLDSEGDIEELLKNEIAEYNKNVAHYKRIQQFHIVSEELPKNRMGKVQRFKLEDFIRKQKAKPEENSENFTPTFKVLKEFIDKELNVNAHSNDHFEIDLAMDSLSKLSVLSFIENAFSIPLKAQQMDELCSLEKLSDYIEKETTTYNENQISWKEILQTEKSSLKLPHSGFIHWFTANIVKLVFHCYFLLKGKGREHIPNEPVIFVANHRSGLDGAFITSKLPWKRVKESFFFAKDKHFKSLFSRFMAPRNNIILMNINDSLRESILQMSEVLRKGKNVIIFPEGTRSKDSVMKEFKDMFAILSSELNIPMVPIAISGAERAAFKFKRIPRPFTRILVEFLPTVYPNQKENVQELKEKVQKMIEKVL
ncbi:MAG: AMP-binding protein [Bacteroidales bacterium]|jgi:long-chain acyl-CoA synthetase|nr:AMP-binding protein [Bacteroidales bacterium]